MISPKIFKKAEEKISAKKLQSVSDCEELRKKNGRISMAKRITFGILTAGVSEVVRYTDAKEAAEDEILRTTQANLAVSETKDKELPAETQAAET